MLNYHIEKSLSEKEKALVLRIGNEITPISLGALRKLAGPRDGALLDFLFKGKPSDNCRYCRIPYPQTEQALKLLAAAGQLYFNSKNLVCDLFAKTKFYYSIDFPKVSGRIEMSKEDVDLSAVDFVCAGPPHWFVKGIVLKFIGSDISWKALQAILQGKASADDLEEDIEVRFVGNSQALLAHTQQPLPILKLTDRSGAFANLWMKGADGKERLFEQGMNAAEKGWEKDLLETGFTSKIVGKSHYYCPMDQVGKSLAFLLELGWTIEDWQERKVVKESGSHIEVTCNNETVEIKGNLHFDQYEADLSSVLGAFNRRDKFIELGNGIVGLLPEKIPGDGALAEGLIIPKNRLSILEKLIDEGAQIDRGTKELWDSLRDFKGLQESPPSPLFKGLLRPYQQKGVDWLNFLYTYRLQGILADDMGLGKTVQVLAFLSRLELQKPILIVLPTSLIFNWRKEFERFLPHLKIAIHQGFNRQKDPEKLKLEQVLLTTYATLRLDSEILAQVPFQVAVLDEAQAIKNASTQTFQAACSLKTDFRLNLTGTPIENRLEELWAHFHFLMPTLLGSEKDFQTELRTGEADLRYLQRIQRKIRPFILRRKKEEVAPELPEKIEQVVWVEMDPLQRVAYEKVLQGARQIAADGVDGRQMEILEKLLRLRQMCCHPLLTGEEEAPSAKMEALLEDLKTVAAENKKGLVYSQFTSFLTLIKRKLDDQEIPYAYLDGSTRDREGVVSRFQTDSALPLFLISLKAGGVGLNLTSADYVFLADPWWNEAAENQAIDRAHRIGRKEPVIAKRYVMVESVEEKIMTLKAHKRSLSENLFEDPSSFKALSAEDLLFLLS